MADRKTYLVTDRAGEWVAGQRRPASGRIVLTDAQAEYELILGTIKPLPEPAPAPQKKVRGRKARAPKG